MHIQTLSSHCVLHDSFSVRIYQRQSIVVDIAAFPFPYINTAVNIESTVNEHKLHVEAGSLCCDRSMVCVAKNFGGSIILNIYA